MLYLVLQYLIFTVSYVFFKIDLEKILQNTSGKYCVGDQVRLVTSKQLTHAGDWVIPW